MRLFARNHDFERPDLEEQGSVEDEEVEGYVWWERRIKYLVVYGVFVPVGLDV